MPDCSQLYPPVPAQNREINLVVWDTRNKGQKLKQKIMFIIVMCSTNEFYFNMKEIIVHTKMLNEVGFFFFSWKEGIFSLVVNHCDLAEICLKICNSSFKNNNC